PRIFQSQHTLGTRRGPNAHPGNQNDRYDLGQPELQQQKNADTHERAKRARHQRQITNAPSCNRERRVIQPGQFLFGAQAEILPIRSYSWASVISTFTKSPAAGSTPSGTSLISTQPSMSGACVSILPCHSSSLSFDSPSNNTRTTLPTRARFFRREIFACSFIRLLR